MSRLEKSAGTSFLKPGGPALAAGGRQRLVGRIEEPSRQVGLAVILENGTDVGDEQDGRPRQWRRPKAPVVIELFGTIAPRAAAERVVMLSEVWVISSSSESPSASQDCAPSRTTSTSDACHLK